MPPFDYSQLELFVIGTSAGGLDVLNSLLPAFTKTGKIKVCVVIHLPPDGVNLIPELMRSRCALTVKEAEPGEALVPDTIYISPPDYHLCLEPNHILTLSSEEPVNFSRPSIDLLFESAAYAYGPRVCGILCTGANNDGASGLKRIQEAGGLTIVQNPGEAEYSMMPASALEIMKPEFILMTREISLFIKDICEKGKGHA